MRISWRPTDLRFLVWGSGRSERKASRNDRPDGKCGNPFLLRWRVKEAINARALKFKFVSVHALQKGPSGKSRKVRRAAVTPRFWRSSGSPHGSSQDEPGGNTGLSGRLLKSYRVLHNVRHFDLHRNACTEGLSFCDLRRNPYAEHPSLVINNLAAPLATIQADHAQGKAAAGRYGLPTGLFGVSDRLPGSTKMLQTRLILP